MKNNAVKTIIIFILILMGLYDLGGMPSGMDNELKSWVTLVVVLFCVGCYFILKWLLNLIDRKSMSNLYFVPLSIFLSLLVLWIMRAILYAIISTIFSSNINISKDNSEDIKDTVSAKEIYSKNEMKEFYDTISNVYSNYNYNFSFRIPKGWKRDKGSSKHTVLGVYSEEEYSIISVNVVDFGSNKNNLTIWDLASDLNKYAKKIAKELNKRDYFPTVYKSKRTYFANYEAIRTDIISEYKQDNYKVDFHDATYQVIRNNYVFTIGIKVPEVLYKEKPTYYTDLLTNFIFLY